MVHDLPTSDPEGRPWPRQASQRSWGSRVRQAETKNRQWFQEGPSCSTSSRRTCTCRGTTEIGEGRQRNNQQRKAHEGSATHSSPTPVPAMRTHLLLPPCTTLNIWKLSDACFAAAEYRKGFMKPRDGLPADNNWSFSSPTTPGSTQYVRVSTEAEPLKLQARRASTWQIPHQHDCALHSPAKIGPEAEVPPDTSKSPFCTTKMLLPKAATSLSAQETWGRTTR